VNLFSTHLLQIMFQNDFRNYEKMQLTSCNTIVDECVSSHSPSSPYLTFDSRMIAIEESIAKHENLIQKLSTRVDIITGEVNYLFERIKTFILKCCGCIYISFYVDTFFRDKT